MSLRDEALQSLKRRGQRCTACAFIDGMAEADADEVRGALADVTVPTSGLHGALAKRVQDNPGYSVNPLPTQPTLARHRRGDCSG